MSDDTLHAEALEVYAEAIDAASRNRESYLTDYRFWRLGEQWPEQIVAIRNTPGQERPMLTINRGPAFANQVINDIRQNRPQIKVRPVDSSADIQTALVISGIIRNIEVSSNAAAAYDTAAEHAVFGGFGYFKVNYDYACDDSFDMDIKIERVANPLNIVGDPYSQAVDSSDWNYAFEVNLLSEEQFEREYPDADKISFSALDADVRKHWSAGDDILVAAYWKRSEVEKTIYRMSDGMVIGKDEYLAPNPDGGPGLKDIMDSAGIVITGERVVRSYKVKKCILNGQEILNKPASYKNGRDERKDSYDWPGKFIPIIPVYGVEINEDGERLFRSMMHDAKDSQRQLNYWETTATELVALGPRVPFIGEQGSFDIDANWKTAHLHNHPYLEYTKGRTPPQRMQVDSGPALGAMTQAKQASDNMKAVLGMYDASIGNRSNETSGIAIERRQREGDTGQFHFSDNLMRAIRHGGLVVMDLIPHVYASGRVARVLGEDGTAQAVQIGPRQYPETENPDGPPPRIGALQGVFDIAMGKYDLTVEAGPSYTTQRQETAEVVGKLMTAYPPLVGIGGDILVKNLDLKDGDELARRLGKMLPPQLQDNAEEQIPPQVLQMIEQGKQIIAEQQEEIAKLKQDEVGKVATIQKAQADSEKNAVERDKTALERERIPIENAQAQAALLQAQKELELTRAQLGQATAETKVVNGIPAALDVVAQAGLALAAAAQQIASAAALMAAPKEKQVEMVRNVTGGYSAQVVERPMRPAVQ